MDRRALILLLLCGCSSPYDVRLSDDKSACAGSLFFFGWADPPLIPGGRLVDAPPGSRVVLWNEAGLEAIVDLGETCAVLVRDDKSARAPTEIELSVIAAVFPAWPLAPSSRIADYAAERRLERRFPTHVRDFVHALDPAAAVELVLDCPPPVERSFYGLDGALTVVAVEAPVEALPRILDRAMSLENRTSVLLALLEKSTLEPDFLARIARAGAPVQAARHPAADEAVCLAAVETIAKETLSSSRRSHLLDVLDSPAVTALVREKILAVPLAYPEDREAVRAKAGAPK